ncbi:MAG TPA: hypothetical protein VKV23_03390 [Acidimicrobiales bacterium]|nr:hypothetical protein [Acidimicrobiales bacterium]
MTPAAREAAGRPARVAPADGLLALCAALAVLAVAAHAPVAWRALATFGFVGLVPGYALVRLVELGTGLERAVLAVAASLSLATVVSVGFSLGHAFSALAVLSCLAGLTGVLVAGRVARRPRSSP